LTCTSLKISPDENMTKTAVEPLTIETDVLVIGAGGAGMYAALAAAESADVVLLDKNMIGRGGATVMAQMTVAAAMAEQEPDDVESHIADTLAAGHGLNDPVLVKRLCELAPERMLDMEAWGVGWAKEGNHIHQVHAPGHGVSRCCYVDVLNTGPAVAGLLRKRVTKTPAIRRLSDLHIFALKTDDKDRIAGAAGFDVASGASIDIKAHAVIIATGGLTGLFERNSASRNMLGDGFALALRAGAELIDMEFVQFFPIGHLAPRLVGMDPIMWDPFRYKLGGRLLNGQREEFIHNYGGQDDGKYTATRDLATYAICKEVEAGRGSPNGGVFLSFEHIAHQQLVDAFGPVIKKLAANEIDLTQTAIEVSPIAHYHMGGIKVKETMETAVPGLFAAGEAVGGASGANRLSGNAITEALVFGEIAGREAARHVSASAHQAPSGTPRTHAPNITSHADDTQCVLRLRELKHLMWHQVGPFRDAQGLSTALAQIRQWQLELPAKPAPATFANELVDWYELETALTVAETIALAALNRKESRGAHQREDYPAPSEALTVNQTLRLADNQLIAELPVQND
jgi:succinate dehydrogenase/fumarate reductase flavoprotein subunit